MILDADLAGLRYEGHRVCSTFPYAISNMNIPPLFGLFSVVFEIFSQNLISDMDFIIEIYRLLLTV